MAESDYVQDERYVAEAMDGRERRCSGLGKNHGSDVAHDADVIAETRRNERGKSGFASEFQRCIGHHICVHRKSNHRCGRHHRS